MQIVIVYPGERAMREDSVAVTNSPGGCFFTAAGPPLFMPTSLE